jgi:pimeloyl-ACP methyl ester carboxylesterase
VTNNTRASPAVDVIAEAKQSAPWITMVHGVSQDRRLFSAQVEEFSRSFRILLIDLPGHGRSADIPGPYGLVEFALSIEAALDESGVDASHFWGTHLGAGAGLLLAARAPERFRSLVLEAPVFPGRPLPAVARVLERIRSTAQRLGVEHARKQWFEESEWFAVMRQNPVRCRAHEHWEMVLDSVAARGSIRAWRGRSNR